ncbi:MAG: DNA-directed RNA polymerase subunit omega [Lachnospiraceae bacterium]|nr:DNA-directed RNA polymerase subunit omega [Lachnospiraceae bacterium]
MLHPSYSDLIRIVNSESEQDTPVVNSRFSIVMATAKRARQIVAGEAYVSAKDAAKPLSTAVKELADGSITILPEEEEEEPQIEAVQEETAEDVEE